MASTDIATWQEYQAKHLKTVVTLAGRPYELKYRLQELADIEQRTGKTLWNAIVSGELRDTATILWVGLKHTDKKLGSPDAVIDLLQRHLEDAPGNSTRSVFFAAVRCAVASKLLGGPEEVSVEELERVLRVISGESAVDDGGKDQAPTTL